jgi:hypothetical protein
MLVGKDANLNPGGAYIRLYTGIDLRCSGVFSGTIVTEQITRIFAIHVNDGIRNSVRYHGYLWEHTSTGIDGFL